MIRHIVFVRFAPTTLDAKVDAIFAELAALRQHLPGLLAFTAGPDTSPEGLSKGYTHAFTADFASAADRDAYLAHPAHQAAGARLVRALDGGLGGLIVLDIPLDAPAP